VRPVGNRKPGWPAVVPVRPNVSHVKPRAWLINDRDSLISALSRYRLWAGAPSYEVMSERMGGELTPRAIQEILAGKRRKIPRKYAVMAILHSLGAPDEDLAEYMDIVLKLPVPR
jgi:hypothetical protein